jgi:hypothetical protein
MNKATLIALKGSIQKWHDIAYHSGMDDGINNCPLCGLFWTDDCIGCPVAIETMDTYCYGSPYTTWGCEQTKANAIAELKFLVTLLPKGEEAEMSDGNIWYWEWSE